MDDVEAHGGPVAGDLSATMHTGPLGSAIHVLRADAGTVAELAAIDWNRRFRQVVDGVRFGLTADERKEAVARVVRRRRAGIRVREEGADRGAPLHESAP